MAREKAPDVYDAGTLRPEFLPHQPGAGPVTPAEAAPGERRAHVDALDFEGAAWAGRRERLEGDLAPARIRAQLAAAETREHGAQILLDSARADHDAAVISHERRLRETADPLIDRVLVYLRDQADGLRRRGVLQVTERPGPLNILTLTRPGRFFSNAESITRRQQAIRAAMATWEGYRLTALEPTELQALAEALPSSFPAYDQTVAVPTEPLLTAGEQRALDWRLAEEKR